MNGWFPSIGFHQPTHTVRIIPANLFDQPRANFFATISRLISFHIGSREPNPSLTALFAAAPPSRRSLPASVPVLRPTA